MEGKFAGDKKEGYNLFGPLEKKLVDKFVPYIPKWIETYHLTSMTVVWSLLILLFSYIASKTNNINWLWGVSLMILFQYITDLFDGAVGRYRNTGLIKWGYYMDHFLDYFFLASIIIGYCFIMPKIMYDISIINLKFFSLGWEINYYYLMFFIFAIFVGFMVNSYLSFAATNKFRIAYFHIGPTEVRLLFIFINTMLILFGKSYLGWSLPYALILSLLGLIVVVYRTQKHLWNLDMEQKELSK